MTEDQIDAMRKAGAELGRRYRKAETAFKQASDDTKAWALTALRAGIGPSEVARLSTLTDAYIRKLAREAGIAPARASGFASGQPNPQGSKGK